MFQKRKQLPTLCFKKKKKRAACFKRRTAQRAAAHKNTKVFVSRKRRNTKQEDN